MRLGWRCRWRHRRRRRSRVLARLSCARPECGVASRGRERRMCRRALRVCCRDRRGILRRRLDCRRERRIACRIEARRRRRAAVTLAAHMRRVDYDTVEQYVSTIERLRRAEVIVERERLRLHLGDRHILLKHCPAHALRARWRGKRALVEEVVAFGGQQTRRVERTELLLAR